MLQYAQCAREDGGIETAAAKRQKSQEGGCGMSRPEAVANPSVTISKKRGQTVWSISTDWRQLTRPSGVYAAIRKGVKKRA